MNLPSALVVGIMMKSLDIILEREQGSVFSTCHSNFPRFAYNRSATFPFVTFDHGIDCHVGTK